MYYTVINNMNVIMHGNVSWQFHLYLRTYVGARFSIDLAFWVKSSLHVALTECWRLDLSYVYKNN